MRRARLWSAAPVTLAPLYGGPGLEGDEGGPGASLGVFPWRGIESDFAGRRVEIDRADFERVPVRRPHGMPRARRAFAPCWRDIVPGRQHVPISSRTRVTTVALKCKWVSGGAKIPV